MSKFTKAIDIDAEQDIEKLDDDMVSKWFSTLLDYTEQARRGGVVLSLDDWIGMGAMEREAWARGGDNVNSEMFGDAEETVTELQDEMKKMMDSMKTTTAKGFRGKGKGKR